MATIEEIPPSVNSEQGEAGTHSQSQSELNQSIDSSHENSSIQNQTDTDSNAPLSSRGSTRATGEDDTMSFATYRNQNPDYIYRHHYYGTETEDERDEDGSPMLTNRFFWELFKRENKKYYRTPSLNEKLYLHYKGFSYIRNLEQFTDLKCLYFEGNGCKSMKGLEKNVKLRSLMIQENIIEQIEGLDTLKDLRQLNVNENMLKTVSGLAGCEMLDTIYLKRNRIGKDERGDVESIKGLLERPTLTCVDLQDNYLSDPAIFEEVLYKMPNLAVLYLQNNPVVKTVDYYRKTLIAKIPSLKYLDDRPVFEEDRRRAEAFARGGMDEERKEIKKIKKEKDDKHWSSHEAFKLMVNKAKLDKKTRDEEEAEAKEYKKVSMKEAMAAARIARDSGIDQKKILERSAMDGSYTYEKNDIQKANEFYEDVKAKGEERYQEKQEGVEHAEDVSQIEDYRDINKKAGKEARKEYEQKVETEMQKDLETLKSTAATPEDRERIEAEYHRMKKFDGGQKMTIEEVPDDLVDQNEEVCPELEKVELEELEKTKQEKNAEWLAKVVKEQEASKQAQTEQVTNTEVADDASSQKSEVDLEDILLDEKKVTEVQNKINKQDIIDKIESQVEAIQQEEETDFDQLD